MSIPTKLTIYVPDEADSQSIALRAGLRAVMRVVCVAPPEAFPREAMWADACRAFFDAHQGLLDVVTHGGTAVLRSMTSGDHDLRVHLPDGLDYDHVQEALGESGVAEAYVRRGGWTERRPADKIRVFPRPLYSVGGKRYEGVCP